MRRYSLAMMKKIGEIKRLQVQPVLVKSGDPAQYDPAGLVAVAHLVIDEIGVMGRTADGRQLLDVHHPDHPNSRYRGSNGVSVGFTFHYEHMRSHFGPHMVTGCAAENILIDTDRILTLPEFGRYLLIRRTAADRWVVLQEPQVAAPCLPFSRFAAQEVQNSAKVKAALQFLHQGMRGYYLTPVNGSADTVVAVGDSVFTADVLPE